MSERLQLCLLALLCAAFVALSLAFNLTADDAYISFRYARNWAAGRGLVYNPGEYIEGYSNFAWVVLLGLLARLGFDIETAAKTLGIACGIGCMVALYGFTRRRTSAWGGVLASSILAIFGPFASWAGAGLETSLFALLVFLSAASFADGVKDGRLRSTTGNWLALAALTRLDGALIAGGLLVALVIVRPKLLRRAWRPGAIFVAVCAGYFLMRWRYYGQLVPHMYFVKVATVTVDKLGWSYLARFVWEYPFVPLAFLLPAAALWRAARRRFMSDAGAAAILFAPVCILWAAWVVRTDGDWMPCYRRFAPLAPLLAYLLAASYTSANAWLMTRASELVVRLWSVGRVLLLLGLVQYLLTPSVRELMCLHRSTYASHRVKTMRELSVAGRKVGAWLRSNANPCDSLATRGIGALGYFSGLTIVDFHGLVDGRHPRKEDMAPLSWPGRKIVAPVAYILSKRPTFIIPEAEISSRPLEGVKESSKFPGYVAVSLSVPEIGGFIRCLMRQDVFERRAVPARGGGFKLKRVDEDRKLYGRAEVTEHHESYRMAMAWTEAICCPVGTAENSPALQCWERGSLSGP